MATKDSRVGELLIGHPKLSLSENGDIIHTTSSAY